MQRSVVPLRLSDSGSEVADANRRIDEEESCAAHGRNGTQGNSRTNTRTNPEVMKSLNVAAPEPAVEGRRELTVLGDLIGDVR